MTSAASTRWLRPPARHAPRQGRRRRLTRAEPSRRVAPVGWPEARDDYWRGPHAESRLPSSANGGWQGFGLLLALWSTGLAALSGVAMTLKLGRLLVVFHAEGLLPLGVALSLVGVFGPGCASAAALLALVHWAQARAPLKRREVLPFALTRGLGGCVAALPLTVCIAMASAFVTGFAVFGVDGATFSAEAAKGLTPHDLAWSVTRAAASGLFLMLASGLLLPAFERRGWPLPVRLLVAGGIAVAVNAGIDAAASVSH